MSKNALPVGYQLHEYVIEKTLGHGGFGITYLARDTNLDTLVAIKEYLPQEFAVREDQTNVVPKSSSDEESYKWGLERFLVEARILGKFKHPNIVRVIRYFPANETAYLVMEFEPGESLEDYIIKHGHGLSEEHIKGLFLPILDGLRAAHDIDLLHRDITPDNIYLRADGTPMLIDFGSARYALGDKTQSLTAMVKKGYAPFEQYSSDSKKQGAWTDIYSIGASLYFCILGGLIPDANDRSSALIDDEPDPYQALSKRVKGQYTEKFLNSIDHALAFKIKDRPQTVREFQQALIPPSVAPPLDLPNNLAVPIPTSKKHYKILAGLGMILSISIVTYMQTQGREPLIVANPKPELTEQEKIKLQADNGDSNAQYKLALKYFEEGRFDSAYVYFNKAASKGLAEAQFRLGGMYLSGKGVSKINPMEALNLIQKAADQRYEPAQNKHKVLQDDMNVQYKLASDYYEQREFNSAYFFFHRAALKGHQISQLKLGEMYMSGKGVEKNKKEAIVWFRKVAIQGDANAQYFLAALFYKDRTDEKNYNKAKLWFKKAADQGHKKALRVYEIFPSLDKWLST